MSLSTDLQAATAKAALLEAELAACLDQPDPDPEPDPDPIPDPEPGGPWPPMPPIPEPPTNGILFNPTSYDPAKIVAGGTYIFGAGVYNTTIATKDDVQLVGLSGAVLKGNNNLNLAFSPTGKRVKVWGFTYQEFRGVNSDGIPNVKGAGAVLLQDGWEMYDCHGLNNRHMAARFQGSDALIMGGSLSGNHQYGHGGTGHRCRVWGVEISNNGDGIGVSVDNDRGGSKMVHSDFFSQMWCHSHDNKWNGLWSDIDNWQHEYAYNVIEGNGGAGIQYEVSFAGKIHHNRLIDNWRKHGGTDGDPKKAAIQTSMSPDMQIYENDIEGALYAISIFNQDHDQWRLKKMKPGRCLGARNASIHDNRVTVRNSPDGEKPIAVFALDGPGSIPSDRSEDQKCGQFEAADRRSNNRFFDNTVTIVNPTKNPDTPYIVNGQFVTAAAFVTASKP